MGCFQDRGTRFFGGGKLKLALIKYKRVEEILEYEKSGDPEEKRVSISSADGTLESLLKWIYSRKRSIQFNEFYSQQRDALLLAGLLNIALVYSKMNEQVKCVEYCDKVSLLP